MLQFFNLLNIYPLKSIHIDKWKQQLNNKIFFVKILYLLFLLILTQRTNRQFLWYLAGLGLEPACFTKPWFTLDQLSYGPSSRSSRKYSCACNRCLYVFLNIKAKIPKYSLWNHYTTPTCTKTRFTLYSVTNEWRTQVKGFTVLRRRRYLRLPARTPHSVTRLRDCPARLQKAWKIIFKIQ